MEVKLVVVSGSRSGEEVPVGGPKFFIGRAEDCHLRPRSDLVSRHHCAVIVEEGYVAIRDFGSKNGTTVNGEAVKGEQELKDGDRLEVGDLVFEIRLSVGVGGEKKPKVDSVQEAAARTAEPSIYDDMDLDSWLTDTDTQTLEPTQTEGPSDDDDPEERERKQEKKRQKKAEVPGVWNKGRWNPTSENPRDAAADTLKNFFRRPQ
jgi:pSer/pThr/pTyr-binding forkhead associated (FHA) protein